MSDCTKKRRPTQMAAIAAAIRCSRDGGPLRVYQCPNCHGWHLTKKVKMAKAKGTNT